jgi:hypothetical protein
VVAAEYRKTTVAVKRALPPGNTPGKNSSNLGSGMWGKAASMMKPLGSSPQGTGSSGTVGASKRPQAPEGVGKQRSQRSSRQNIFSEGAAGSAVSLTDGLASVAPAQASANGRGSDGFATFSSAKIKLTWLQRLLPMWYSAEKVR